MTQAVTVHRRRHDRLELLASGDVALPPSGAAFDYYEPGLVQSVTEDDDEEAERMQRKSNNNYNRIHRHTTGEEEFRCSSFTDEFGATEETDAHGGRRREALAYLLSYENMVRQQDADAIATLAHLRPCLERIQAFLDAEPSSQKDDDERVLQNNASEEEDIFNANSFWARTVSFAQLKQALQYLEATAASPLPSSGDETKKQYGAADCMTTDRQLMLVLRLLTQDSVTEDVEASVMTWAEVVQCYRTCIAGMHTLQHLPSPVTTSSQEEDNRNNNGAMTIRMQRQRVRERTLAMLSLFQQKPSHHLIHVGASPEISSKVKRVDEQDASKMMEAAKKSVATSAFESTVRSPSPSRLIAAAIILCTIAGVYYKADIWLSSTNVQAAKSVIVVQPQADPEVEIPSSTTSPPNERSSPLTSHPFECQSTLKEQRTSSSSSTARRLASRDMLQARSFPLQGHDSGSWDAYQMQHNQEQQRRFMEQRFKANAPISVPPAFLVGAVVLPPLFVTAMQLILRLPAPQLTATLWCGAGLVSLMAAVAEWARRFWPVRRA